MVERTSFIGLLSASLLWGGQVFAQEPEQATAEPEQGTAEPEQATAEPEQATAEPEQATAEPEQATAELEQATATAEGEMSPGASTDASGERPADDLPSVTIHQTTPDPALLSDKDPAFAPIESEAEPRSELRKAELGPLVGTLYRGAEGGDVSYSWGVSYGGYARVELWRWIAVRLLVTRSEHSVAIRRGSFGLPDSSIEQDDFSLLEMAARLEPTWTVAPRLRVRGAAGMGWSRISVPAPRSEGALQIRGAERFGVMVDATLGAAASYDVILHRLAVDLSVDGGLVWGETGSAFERSQVFDQEGRRHYVGGLPEFNGTFSVLLGVGLVL